MYQQHLFEERFALAEKIWKEAKMLPKEAMTAARLRELEYEKNIAFCSPFLWDSLLCSGLYPT